MNTINEPLQASVRQTVKSARQDLAAGRQKTGKEVYSDGRQKLQDRSLRRHAAMTSKFLTEEGKGGTLNLTKI